VGSTTGFWLAALDAVTLEQTLELGARPPNRARDSSEDALVPIEKRQPFGLAAG
jgi:hypothetical protein